MRNVGNACYMGLIRNRIEAWHRKRHTLTVAQPVQMVRVGGGVVTEVPPPVADVQVGMSFDSHGNVHVADTDGAVWVNKDPIVLDIATKDIDVRYVRMTLKE